MTNDAERVSSLAETQERIRVAERRLTEIDNELISLNGKLVADEEVRMALAGFDQLWEPLCRANKPACWNCLSSASNTTASMATFRSPFTPAASNR